MKTPIHDEPRLTAAAERQMQSWARMEELQSRVDGGHSVPRLPAQAIVWLTILRESGADGTAIGRLVGSRLGWEVYSKNLLDQTAQRFGESRLMLNLVDETPSNWVYDMFGAWMDRHLISREKYIAHVGRVIQSLARRGNAVFVGRGAMFLIPRAKSLTVRIVASERYRLARIMETRNLSLADARRWMNETDRGRRDFIERFFHRNIDDPHLYDMVLNSEQLGQAEAVRLILAALGRT